MTVCAHRAHALEAVTDRTSAGRSRSGSQFGLQLSGDRDALRCFAIDADDAEGGVPVGRDLGGGIAFERADRTCHASGGTGGAQRPIDHRPELRRVDGALLGMEDDEVLFGAEAREVFGD
ncbi:hypothetical protein ACQPZ2_31630 [Nocardia pseudovaccinii]|uniref:hypothetical protein n=1 Tax=Nocardia pseudovaccinii TaxID=189540 RepID=UPI003D8C8737